MVTYPDRSEIAHVENPQAWLDKHFFRQDPARFQHSTTDFHSIACGFSSEIDVERNGIFCIGSSALGFSLNPSKIRNMQLQHVRDESDIDLAIISHYHFELAWRDLLRLVQPKLQERNVVLEEAIKHQRKRLFSGAILANKLMSELSFGPIWMPAIERLSQKIAICLDKSVSVEVWIYRDYWSLRNYVSEGLVACQRALR